MLIINYLFFRTCELIQKSITTVAACEFNGVNVPCKENVQVWTTVTIGCNIGFRKKYDDQGQWNDKNKCLNSGKWLHPMPTCTYGKYSKTFQITRQKDIKYRCWVSELFLGKCVNMRISL